MRNAIAAALSVMVAGLFLSSPSWAQRKAEPGAFDYYVLSLSWTPTYCARDRSGPDPDQCGEKKYGFVVHGLWPQYTDGSYPATCSRDRNVPKAAVDQTMAVMPSVGLMMHEWRKHGTCSGLDAGDYFAKLRAAAAKVAIPDTLKAPGPTVPALQVERLFLDANPGLTPEGVAVMCSRRDVSEVRVCLDKDLGFMPCGQKVVDRCRDRDAALSPEVSQSPQPRGRAAAPAASALPPAPAPVPLSAPMR
ncbi:ribonuclease T2 family protein [Azospirillum picis]|uniref:Ribonuclease T2 n=1 Tax=Azospirillum picis TaxID=488438 RepID=A0ABU0ML54_9PROT|nr:ribonuclease T2 [Azospirillum picis]MBP2300185.1 ribonuclease T2 [Azospirillum picis]MDQ0533973.1 ribonuclease T2 [Azospirillum picis]